MPYFLPRLLTQPCDLLAASFGIWSYRNNSINYIGMNGTKGLPTEEQFYDWVINTEGNVWQINIYPSKSSVITFGSRPLKKTIRSAHHNHYGMMLNETMDMVSRFFNLIDEAEYVRAFGDAYNRRHGYDQTA